MKAADVLELVDLSLPDPNGRRRRLASAHTVEDLERIARRALPRSVYDYVAGGAEEERSLSNNGAAIRRWRFAPTALADVTNADSRTSLFGHDARAPFGFAPTGYTRMIDTTGEPAVAAAAGAAGIPYVLSTMATTSLEDLATLSPSTDRWFQLYVWKDRGLTRELVDRAQLAGYRVLEVAIDTAVAALRTRDVKSGFTIPPRLTLRSVFDIGTRPRYWWAMLRSPTLQFANVSSPSGSGASGYSIANITQQFDPGVTWSDLEEIRSHWHGPLVLKGPIGPADALRARDLGIDGVHLSNHGGRQLDRAVAPIDLVRPVRESVGPGMSVFVDSGFTHGADVATAIALGADAAFLGRAYLWGLAAGGRPGVDRVARIVHQELLRTMQLLGVSTIDELRSRGHELLALA